MREPKTYSGKRIAIIIWLLAGVIMCFVKCAHGQCIADECPEAVTVSECILFNFCNTDCNFDFYENQSWPYGDPAYDHETWSSNECHGINYDLWLEFTYPADGTGHLDIGILNGNCLHPDGLITNYGPAEGWHILLWRGDYCSDMELIWSTACYWAMDSIPNEIDWFGINLFDPTRQNWMITITNAIPNQHYYVQIDGFGWCTGCGDFYWCSELNFLELPDDTPIESIRELTSNTGQENGYRYHFDALGRITGRK